MIRTIAFHRGHMIDSRPGGLIIITRFIEGGRRVYRFNVGLWGDKAMAWGREWI